jgi:omega-6 fatty acid desaturase (delta-12 desaturase)
VGRSAWQLGSSLAGYAATLSIVYAGLDRGSWVSLALAPIAALFTVRLFIIQHDCGHASFFRSRRANDLAGAFIGVLTLTPYNEWRMRHAVHHRVSGNLDRRGVGDIDTLTTREYLALPACRRAQYRASRHPVVLFIVGPAYQFFLRQRLPADLRNASAADWRSVMGTNAAVIAAAVAAAYAVGPWHFLLVQTIVNWTASSVGVWLFFVQHQFEQTYWAADEHWVFEDACLAGSSFLDVHPILHWCTGNIGYHHIHHLSPKVPNYRLRACLTVHPNLMAVHRLTLREALRSWRFTLWDEERRLLVDFASAHTEAASTSKRNGRWSVPRKTTQAQST